MEMDGYITVAAAAEVLGVTPGRVRQLVSAGTLPAVKMHRQLMLLKRADVDALAATPRPAGWPSGKPRKPPTPAASHTSAPDASSSDQQ